MRSGVDGRDSLRSLTGKVITESTLSAATQELMKIRAGQING